MDLYTRFLEKLVVTVLMPKLEKALGAQEGFQDIPVELQARYRLKREIAALLKAKP